MSAGAPFLGERDLVRRRPGVGSYDGEGRFVAAAAVDTPFRGSVQPMTGRDRQVLREGLRSRTGRRIYCPRGTLRPDDQHAGTSADLVVIDGVEHTVVHVDDEHELIEHDRVIVLRAQETEP